MDKETALKILRELHDKALFSERTALETLHPELKESEDERIRRDIIRYLKKTSPAIGENIEKMLAWLEKQSNEPKWCHHKVDLSNCSEEYRKAYYDGWNNCNMQHSQCKSDGNDVVKCLINGMKFYYEDNKEATWGTEKFSMKVKDILSWLEKQGEFYTKRDVDNAYIEGMAFAKDELEKQNKQILANSAKTCKDEQQPTDNDMKELLHTEYEKGRADVISEFQKAWSEEDESYLNTTIAYLKDAKEFKKSAENCINWLKSLKDRVQPRRRHTIFDEII